MFCDLHYYLVIHKNTRRFRRNRVIIMNTRIMDTGYKWLIWTNRVDTVGRKCRSFQGIVSLRETQLVHVDDRDLRVFSDTEPEGRACRSPTKSSR